MTNARATDAYDYAASPIHMVMVVEYDASNVPQAYYEIRDDKLVREIEGFFPGYRDFARFESDEWKTTVYRIYMCLHAGRTIKLISDGERWGVTFGGAPLSGDLKAFLKRLPKNLISLEESVRSIRTLFPSGRAKRSLRRDGTGA